MVGFFVVYKYVTSILDPFCNSPFLCCDSDNNGCIKYHSSYGNGKANAILALLPVQVYFRRGNEHRAHRYSIRHIRLHWSLQPIHIHRRSGHHFFDRRDLGRTRVWAALPDLPRRSDNRRYPRDSRGFPENFRRVWNLGEIGRAHVWTPVTIRSRMPSSSFKKKTK